MSFSMDTTTYENPPRTAATLFGLKRRRRTEAKEQLDEGSEPNAYEWYNHHATIVDKELIKDWNDSLNTLLIFVGFQVSPDL